MALWHSVRYLLYLCLTRVYLTCSFGARDVQHTLGPGGQQPNIVFILTDDQDLHMDSLSYMPYLKKHMTDHGLTFRRHYCTVALCCPSRVSMWTGKAAHNTNVTDINPPYGGYPKFVSQGFNDKYLPVWLQSAGYSTYYVGKLFNAQTIHNYDSPHAGGWTGSEFLLDPYTYRYLNATLQRNHDKPASYEGQYSTDVIAKKTYGFLGDAVDELESKGTPFFLTVAPTAPHSDVNIKQDVIHGNFSETTNVQSPPIPAERHKHLFQDVRVPRTPNFNPDEAGGASWISRLPKQNETNVDFNDHFYRNRLRSLQAVDEMIDELMHRLDKASIMDNTYVIFSTDNGYSIGQHRRQPGKQCAFEEDINIPLIVRGPGIPVGKTTDLVTSHTDLAPTFLSLAHARPPDDFELDGQAIPLTGPGAAEYHREDGASNQWRQEQVNVEMWGIIMSEGRYGSVLYPNHTYKALRVVGEAYDLLYTVWCSGEHELYDMKADSYQLDNLFQGDLSTPNDVPTRKSDPAALNVSTPLPDPISSPNTSKTSSDSSLSPNIISEPRTLEHLIRRLDSLLMVLKTCSGPQCTHPWGALFPNGEVMNLADALDSAFDDFFESSLPWVHFEKCEKGYIAESEGPIWDGSRAYGMVDEMAW